MFWMVSCERLGTSPRASYEAPRIGIFFGWSSARPRMCPNCEGSCSSGAEALHDQPGASGGCTLGQEESHVFPQEREASSANDVKSMDVVWDEKSYVLPREHEGTSANDAKSMERWTVGQEESHVFPQEREASSANDVKSMDVVGDEKSYVLPREHEGPSANDVKSMEDFSLDDALLRFLRAKSVRQAKRAQRAQRAKEMRRKMDALMEGNMNEPDCTNSRSVVVRCAYEYDYADSEESERPRKICL
eukprot:TRINITY_DN13716_c0_g3_i2.p1 TRINITY_DN13716_c0_g3~~TRINITY_DN13716_c0_g3_i2.p1  ORF type:complete len:247 (-),score=23.01 TRINITY_DN13716_c0_g3_i2:56-796(-)